MTGPRDLAQQPFVQILRDMASTQVAPGAGAAGGLCLALAAACGAKAVAISATRHPQDGRFVEPAQKLAEIMRLALVAAARDAHRFEDYTHDRSPESITCLIAAGEEFERLIKALQEVLAETDPYVDPVMKGDVRAALALCEAALVIQRGNSKESRVAKRELVGE